MIGAGSMRVLLAGPHTMGCFMTHLLSRGESDHSFQYKVLNLSNLQIDIIPYIKVTDTNYMNNNYGRI